jgi:MFS family permease
MGKANNRLLFWASFLTLIAAGMGTAIRGDILNTWGREFSFTQTELGKITGMGLMGFGLTIIFFSFFADVVGYGKLMVIAFLLHTASVFVTLAAPYAFGPYGKAGAYWALYIGQFCFSLANGTCEAVINPLTATLYPKNKTHWLNILHAGWPGGLVLGALAGLALNQIGGIGWQIRWGIIFAPMLLYGLMMIGRRFPTSEAKEGGVKLRDMMGQVGLVGALIATVFLGLWLSKDVVPGLSAWASENVSAKLAVPDWVGWGVALVVWLGFSLGTSVRPGEGRPLMISLGFWLLAFLFLIHAMIGYVELGVDNWIQDITKLVLAKDKDYNLNLFSYNILLSTSLLAFIWTNVLMFTLRFFAGPIVHKISPVGLLFVSAVLGAVGLWLLGMPATNTTWLWMGAVTVYGIGKTFYWPTMLGVISERFPRAGALGLGFSAGVGMLCAGILGAPLIGYEQDYAVSEQFRQSPAAQATYERYKSDTPKAPVPYLPEVAGLDNGKVGVLVDFEEIQKKIRMAKEKGETVKEEDKKLKLETDLKLLDEQHKPSDELKKRLEWWQKEGEPNAATDYQIIEDAQRDGGKAALTWTAAIPATMAVCYLLIIFYFLAHGGYKAVTLVDHREQ